MNATIIKPTDSELEILQILWKYGPSTVRFVNETLNKKREVGYTTTLKLMQIMTDKVLVLRDTKQRTHIYYSNIQENDVQRGLVKRMINKAFHGSAMELVMEALGNHQTTPEELKEIKDLIQQLESDSDKKV